MDGLWRERVEGFHGEHKWPENRGSLWESLFQPFLKRENVLHAAHHYTRYGINYRLGVLKKEISVSNIPLITPLDQHMIQIVIRSIPRAYSYC